MHYLKFNFGIHKVLPGYRYAYLYTVYNVFVLQWNEWKALTEAIRSGQLKVISVLVLYRKHLFTNGLANGMMLPF